MYLLDIAFLLPGDIVLTAQDAKVSKAIRRLTGGTFSHAMLYVDYGSLIHSDQQGVHSQNTQRVLLAAPDAAMVLRLARRSDQATIRKICDYARAAVGTQYSIPEAIASRVKRHSNSSARTNRQFCSRLVAEAYSHAGHSLVPNPSYCYPSDLHNIDLLAPVENCVREASKLEIAFAKSPSPLEVQTRVTNAHLEKLRAIASEDIQNEEQTVACLLRRPELDAQFTASLVASGYLDLWKMEVNANPWRYMDSSFAELDLSTADRQHEVKLAKESAERFSRMLNIYQQLGGRFQLQYFAANESLYKKLLGLQLKLVSLMESTDP
ncbi:MAG: hypothetical protein KBG84_16090 [Planctomycetes bacterium]|jgi:hypothetical protein|nr:hypothetical protein [Planctomycetota bacterium]